MLERHESRLTALSLRWKDLEQRIKDAEQITGVVCIPAINELRYSGRRFFEAWRISTSVEQTADTERTFEEHILMSLQYFNNADHDLGDSLISFYAERKRQILEKYGIDRSTEFYSLFIIWVNEINDAQNLIQKSRGDRENRFQYYDELKENKLPSLAAHYKSIALSEELYAARLKRSRFLRAVNSIAGVIGWLAGLLCLYAEWDKIAPGVSGLWHSL